MKKSISIRFSKNSLFTLSPNYHQYFSLNRQSVSCPTIYFTIFLQLYKLYPLISILFVLSFYSSQRLRHFPLRRIECEYSMRTNFASNGRKPLVFFLQKEKKTRSFGASYKPRSCWTSNWYLWQKEEVNMNRRLSWDEG